jgi:hypothetical protein
MRIPRTALGVGVVVLLIAVAGAAALLVVNRRDEGPRTVSTEAFWVHHFDTSAQMLATADLVVEGTVTAVTPGRVLPGDSPVRHQVKEFRVQPGEVLRGSTQASSLTVEALGWELSEDANEGRAEIVVNGVVLPAAGDAGVFFLKRSSDGALNFINDQGVLLYADNRVRRTGRSDPLVRRLEALSVADLKRQLARDRTAVDAGKVLLQPAK